MSINQQELEESCIFSIETDNLEKLKQFLSSGFNVNSVLRSRNKIWDTNCLTILAIASFSGSKNIVEYLLQKNVNLNQIDTLKNRTALHWAVASGHYNISKMLIEAGALVNVLDRDSITPLILASNSGDLKIVQLLIKHGANVNHTDRMNTTALHYACMRFHSDIAIELILNGCNCNTNTPFSFCSPLKYLLSDKQYRVAKYLIEAGCDLTNEKWIMDNTFIINNGISESFMIWIRSNLKNPSSLMSICRQKVRKNLGSENLHLKLSTLNIPKHLIDYLKMKF